MHSNEISQDTLDAFGRADMSAPLDPTNPAAHIVPASAEDAALICDMLGCGTSEDWR